MFLITPYHIQAYTKCPKWCYLNYYQIKKHDHSTVDALIIEKVIKTVYLYHLKKDKIASWNRVIKWTEKCITRMNIDTEYNYKDTKNILSKLHSWFFEFYLSDKRYGLINLPTAIGLGPKATLYDSIDIVLLDDKISLVDFISVEDIGSYSNTTFYNDIIVHLKSWLVVNSTDCMLDKYYRVVVGKQSLKVLKINITKDVVSNIEKIVKHITSGILGNIFYPSPSIQCNQCDQINNCYL